MKRIVKAGAHGQHTIFRAVDNQRDEVWIVMPWSGKKETVEEFFADKGKNFAKLAEALVEGKGI